MSDPTQHSDSNGGGHVHVVSPKILIGVFAALMILTILTVAAIKVDLGAMNIWIALGIAVVKAASRAACGHELV